MVDLDTYFSETRPREWQNVDEGTVRFALIGLGWWTRERAIPAIEDSELCRATVAVSSDADKSSEVVEESNTLERGLTYDEFRDGDATGAYDAVYICTPNGAHLRYAESAAEYGKHVLCEKPMEKSTDRAEAMVEACEEGDVRLMVGYRMQTDPAIRRMRELVREGFVGDPALVHSHMTQRLFDINPNPDQWRLDPELAGPGTSVTDLGIYSINTSRFVLDADPTAAVATMDSPSDDFESVPDERASFGLEFEGAVHAACTASQNAAGDGRFEVVGTEGRITLDPAFFEDERRVLRLRRKGTTAEFTVDTVDQMTEEFDYFADRVLSETDVHPDGRHGVTDVRAIEAVYESAETGERIPVSDS